MTDLFARDFDSLEEGARFETPSLTIGEADIGSFAELTGDRHPQHVDDDWARQSPFGGRIAHGMLVLSYASGLVPVDPERVAALRALRDVVFKSPAYPGDTIRVEGKVDRCSPLDEEVGLVTMLWKVVNQHGRTVARARAEVLWRREPRHAEIVPAAASGVVPL